MQFVNIYIYNTLHKYIDILFASTHTHTHTIMYIIKGGYDFAFCILRDDAYNASIEPSSCLLYVYSFV